ncbi:MAG: HAD hydrolase-like protein [Patescibacteria group bacterium]
MKTLIFDFDGTLVDSFELVVDVAYELTGAPRLGEGQIRTLRRLPLLTAVHRLGVRWWSIPKLLVMARPRMYRRMHEVKPFPGIPELLSELHKAGYHMLIMSSNREQNVRACLRAHDLEHYFDGVYHGSVFHKVHGLKRVVKRNKLQRDSAYYIGNEALDVRSAKKVGIPAIAVTWSGQDKARLEASKPLALVSDPQEILNVVKKS